MWAWQLECMRGERGKSFAFVMRGKKGKEEVKLPPTDPYPYWVDMHGDESLIAGNAEKNTDTDLVRISGSEYERNTLAA